MDLNKIKALTIRYGGITNRLTSGVKVSFPKSLLSNGEVAATLDHLAIWDTGATGSAIAELTAKKLNLAPTGIKKVSGLGGTIDKNTYLVDLLLPNGIHLTDFSVTEVDNPKDENGNKIDAFGILIGMDIISIGDFTVTNFEGITIMTFRYPSCHKIDYVDEWNKRMAVQNKNKR